MDVASSDRDGAPVLLVPGFSGQDLVYWNMFHRRLEANGFQAFTFTLPGLGLQDIRTSARMLERRVREVLEATRHDRIHLVGHSLGGLIMREYVQRMGGDARVASCATLGTPHNGTFTATLALLRPACRQMLPGSSFLARLQEAPLSVPFLNIYSARDSLVVPYSNARWEPAENQRLTFGGHWGLLVRRAAYEPIERFLEQHTGGS